MPPHHQAFINGELDVLQLLALLATADVIVGGVGFIVPAAIAAKVKAFVLLGGQGGHNAPEKITDPRFDLTRIGFAFPDRFCRCSNMMHRCDKNNSQLAKQWITWCNQVGLRCSHSLPRAA
jgi:hypothetical protein